MFGKLFRKKPYLTAPYLKIDPNREIEYEDTSRQMRWLCKEMEWEIIEDIPGINIWIGDEAIDLGTKIPQQLHFYLINQMTFITNHRFDCFSFIHCMHDIPYKFGKFEHTRWNSCPFDASNMKPGDCLLMTNDKNWNNRFKFLHVALYIGQGLYMQKFGLTLGLGVADMHNMQKRYQADYFYKITPK